MRAIFNDGWPEPDPCWLRAPAERSAKFLQAFTRVSLAVQSALREHVPALYFKSPDRFRQWKMAYPMLVYQASRPFHGKVLTELTYDVLNPASIVMLYRRARANLIPLLEKVQAELQAQGLTELESRYAPRLAPEVIKSVQRLSVSRRHLYLLVRCDTVLVDALIELSGLGTLLPKEQAKKLSSFRKKWRFQFRRLYPGEDFTILARPILEAASAALRSSQDPGPDAAQT